MKLLRKVGATSQILQIFIADSSSTTGAGLTGLVFNTAGLTAYYHRDTDTTATAISLVTMTVGTFTSSGFKEIDATNMPGWYQFCPPNAALASGASSVGLHLKGATNMAPLPIEIDLDGQVDVALWNGTAVSAPATAGIPDVNVKNMNNVAATSITTISANQGTTQPVNFTGTGASALAKSDMVDIAGAAVATGTAQLGVNVVNFGGSAGTFASGIPAVNTTQLSGTACTARDIGASVLLSSGTGTGQISLSAGAVSNVTLVATTTTVTNQLTAAAIATGVWTDTTAGDFTTALSVGKSLMNGVSLGTGLKIAECVLTDTLTTYTGNTVQTGDSFARIGLAGVGLTNLGDTRIAKLDANVSSRMATYTQPTGFLAATFPTGTIANTTNITAGTITTVTNLTNAPAAGDFTAVMKTSIGTAVAASAVASVTGAVGSVTGNVGGNVVGSVASVTAPVALTSAYDIAKGTVALTESYAALHASPTLTQILCEIRALLAENSVSGTTVTTHKIDGSTTAETFTLNSSTAPTSITRAS